MVRLAAVVEALNPRDLGRGNVSAGFGVYFHDTDGMSGY